LNTSFLKVHKYYLQKARNQHFVKMPLHSWMDYSRQGRRRRSLIMSALLEIQFESGDLIALYSHK